jgi:hypothetical protein
MIKLVIQCHSLVSLTLGILLTDRAVRSVHAELANPFERLRHLAVHLEPKALHTLCGMIRNVTHLTRQSASILSWIGRESSEMCRVCTTCELSPLAAATRGTTEISG